MDKKELTFSDDEQTVCLQPVDSLLFAATQLRDWIRLGRLPIEVRDSLISSLEYYTTRIKTLV